MLIRAVALFIPILLPWLALAADDVLPPEERAAGLNPLDELITPEQRALIDLQRPELRERVAKLAEGHRRLIVDLRHRDTPVKKQFDGTCTAFGVIGAMENLLGGSIE